MDSKAFIRSLILVFATAVLLCVPSVAQATAEAPAPAPGEEEAPPIAWFKAHGWLMWAGFGLFMPLGIIMTRHLQTLTPAWFHIHVGLQVAAVCCIVTSFALAVHKFDALTESLHSRIGLSVVIMTMFQPLLAFIRPHKGSIIRVFWYCSHWIIGMTVIILSWYTISIGLDLYEVEADYKIKTTKTLWAVNMAVLAFFFLLLGRWDYMVSQADKHAPVHGLQVYPSLAHITSVLGFNKDEKSDERLAAERKLAEERGSV